MIVTLILAEGGGLAVRGERKRSTIDLVVPAEPELSRAEGWEQ